VEVVIRKNESRVAALVADAVDRLARSKPDAVLGVATGDTPIPLYRELARRVDAGDTDLSRFRVVMLDEYLGLPAHHDQLYRRFVEHEVIGPLGIDPDRLYGPDSTARGEQVDRAALHYDSLLTRLGVDMQILGIGSDGHIGFNEPMSSLASRTRIKTLTKQTRRDNSRFFNGDLARVPTHVLTQGIGTILDASHVVLLATGPGKAAAVAAAVEGPVTARVPASALQLHRHVTVAVDEAAASELRYVDYYRHTYDNKPDWQGL
jgi:glucosamine-6-phosphate deaminase